MTHSGNCDFAAEGVTLSGVRKDEDWMLTELWRHPFCAGAEGASVKHANLSGKRTKTIPFFKGGIIVFLTIACFGADRQFFYFILEGKYSWKHS